MYFFDMHTYICIREEKSLEYNIIKNYRAAITEWKDSVFLFVFNSYFQCITAVLYFKWVASTFTYKNLLFNTLLCFIFVLWQNVWYHVSCEMQVKQSNRHSTDHVIPPVLFSWLWKVNSELYYLCRLSMLHWL